MKTASPSHINTTPITPNTRRGDDGILTAWKAALDDGSIRSVSGYQVDVLDSLPCEYQPRWARCLLTGR